MKGAQQHVDTETETAAIVVAEIAMMVVVVVVAHVLSCVLQRRRGSHRVKQFSRGVADVGFRREEKLKSNLNVLRLDVTNGVQATHEINT